MQLYVEMWSARQSWRELPQAEREQFFGRICQNWDDRRFGRAIMMLRSAPACRYTAASSVSTAAQRPWNRCRWAASETRS